MRRHQTIRTSIAARCSLAAIVLALGVSACSGDGSATGAAPSTRPSSRADASTTTTTRPMIAGTELATTIEQPANLPGYDVLRPTHLDEARRPLPVLAWANGACARTNEPYRTLLARWAGAGFFVVAVGAPPSGQVLAPSAMTAADQIAAIDWAVAEAARPDSPYFGKLDTERIVVAGNSCGGVLSMQVAAQDVRVDAAYVLSGSSLLPGATNEQIAAAMSTVTAPVLYTIGGEHEDIAHGPSHTDFELAPSGLPFLYLTRAGLDHVQISLDPTFQAQAAQFALQWFDAALYGNVAAVDELLADLPAPWTAESRNLDRLGTQHVQAGG